MALCVRINPCRLNQKIINRIATVVHRGGVLLYPTDTIYGFGCDAFNENAIKRIFKIKRRSSTHPTLVLVRNISMIKQLVQEVPKIASILMERFWPGPLTLVFRGRKNLPPLITLRNQTVGIRIPQNKFCLQLLKKTNTPLVSTSANITGLQPISEIEQLKQLFAEDVDLIVDAGRFTPSLPSTIIDVSGGRISVIREGAISLDDLSPYYNRRA